MPPQIRRSFHRSVTSGFLSVVIAILVGSLVTGFLPSSPAAAATPVRCGTVVRVSITLTADITGCTGPGLIIGANGVTVGLAGHTIRGALTTSREQCEIDADGNGTCFPCDEPNTPACGPPFATPDGYVNESTTPPQAAAIDVTGGFDGVSVRNGHLADFEFGLQAVGADRLTVERLDASSTGCGLCLQDLRAGKFRQIDSGFIDATGVRGSAFDRIAAFLSLTASSQNTVRRSTAEIFVGDSNNNLFEGNSPQGFKPFVIDGGSGNVVRANTFSNTGEAIFIEGAAAHGNLVERNTISGTADGYGIVLLRGTNHNTLRANVVRDAILTPDGFSSAGGIALCDTNDNLLEGNLVSRSFVGITVGVDISCESGAAARNVLRGNVVSQNRGAGELPEQTGDGITVGPNTTSTVLTGNVSDRNQSDGIDVASSSARLTANVATRNGRLGIRAVPGVVDGGLNIARGNGNPAQCTGIVCR